MPAPRGKIIYVLLSIAGALVAAAVLLWIGPHYRLMQEQVQDIKHLRAELTRFQRQQTSQLTPQSFDPYRDTAEKLEAARVTENNLIRLIETLEQTAADSNVTYQLGVQSASEKVTPSPATAPTDQPNPAQKAAPATEIQLQLLLTGPFQNLLTMLKKVENLPAVVNVTAVSMHRPTALEPSAKETAPSSPTASFSLTIPFAPN
jgi:lipopolysaccharide export LptBFGC system permease protein LptF